MTAQLALFRLDVSHERIQDPVTREVLPTGKSVRQGINLDAGVRLTHRLTLMVDGTINDARVKGDPSASPTPVIVPDLAIGRDGQPIRPSFHIEPLEPGDPVPNVASWLGRVGVEAALSRDVSVGAAIELGRFGATLDLELQNMLDTKYPEIRASGFINPGAPRTLSAALRFADRH